MFQYHAVPVQGLERERVVSGNLGQETRVRVAVGIGRLVVAFELAHGKLAENSHPLAGVVVESPLVLAHIWFLKNDADGVNVAVFVTAGVGPLVFPAT